LVDPPGLDANVLNIDHRPLALLAEHGRRPEHDPAAGTQRSTSTLVKSEQATAGGPIALGHLRIAGLESELICALTPRQPLAKQFERQAGLVARYRGMDVRRSMALED